MARGQMLGCAGCFSFLRPQPQRSLNGDSARQRPVIGDFVKILRTSNTQYCFAAGIGKLYMVTEDAQDQQPFKVVGSDVWLFESDVELQGVSTTSRMQDPESEPGRQDFSKNDVPDGDNLSAQDASTFETLEPSMTNQIRSKAEAEAAQQTSCVLKSSAPIESTNQVEEGGVPASVAERAPVVQQCGDVNEVGRQKCNKNINSGDEDVFAKDGCTPEQPAGKLENGAPAEVEPETETAALCNPAVEKADAPSSATVETTDVCPSGESSLPAAPDTVGMDISPARDGSVRKFVITAAVATPLEEGVTPTDGARVEFEFAWRSYEARDEQGDPTEGWAFVGSSEPRKMSLVLGDCECCDALESTIAAMKRGETCVARCGIGGTGDPAAWTDKRLGFGPQSTRGIDMLVSLLSVEKEKDVMEMEPTDRAKYASERKDAGAKYMKEQRYTSALNKYKLVCEVLDYIEDIKDPAAQKEAKALKRAAKLNEGLCHLKLEDWMNTIRVCNDILKDDAENEKALFRRATAYLKQGQFSHAEGDLKRCLASNPNNQEALRLLAQCKSEAAESGAQQKDLYARMLKGAKRQQVK